MNLAFIVYQDLTLLDLVGFYDPITRLRGLGYIPNLKIDFCSYYDDPTDNHGFPLRVDQRRPDLSGYDLVFVPGGFGSRALIQDKSFVSWLKTSAPIPVKTSVCTGALLLAAAGLLDDRRATTHFDEYETLAKFNIEVVASEVIVEDRDCITGGAVASSIELGLHICEKLAGTAARLEIKKRMGL